MKKYLWTLSIPLLLAIILTGCGNVGGSNSATTAAALRPLQATEWPTPLPTTQPAPPTPFPKITLEPTATPTATPTPNATPVFLTTAPSSLNDKAGKLMDQASAAGVGLWSNRPLPIWVGWF